MRSATTASASRVQARSAERCSGKRALMFQVAADRTELGEGALEKVSLEKRGAVINWIFRTHTRSTGNVADSFIRGQADTGIVL